MYEAVFGKDMLSAVLTAAVIGLVLAYTLLFALFTLLRTRFQMPYFIPVCVGWILLLGSSSVWNVSREVRFSLDQAGADTALRFGFLVAALGMLFALNFSSSFRSLKELRSLPFAAFTLFGIWSVATAFWSVSFSGTVYKSIEYLGMLGIFAISASLINGMERGEVRWKALKNIHDLVWVLAFALICSIYIGIIVFPEVGIQRDFRDEAGVVGFSIQGALPGIAENSVGQLGMILCLVAMIRLLCGWGSRPLYIGLFGIAMLTTILSQSRSPVLAFAIAALVVLVLMKRFGLLAFGGLLVFVAGLTAYGGVVYEFMRRGQSIEDITSLTGRTPYWTASLEAVGENPLGGYGANVGGRYVIESFVGSDSVSTVHNAWIEILLDTGVVGLFLFALGILLVCASLAPLRSAVHGSRLGSMLWLESTGVMVLMLVRSAFSVNLVWTWNVLFVGVVLVFVSVAKSQLTDSSSAGSQIEGETNPEGKKPVPGRNTVSSGSKRLSRSR